MTFLKKLVILGIILTVSAAAKSVFTSCDPTPEGPAEDEILLEVYPHIRGEVYAMEMDLSVNGETIGTQGVCHADLRTPLRDREFFRLLPEDYPAIADCPMFSVSLSIQTEPFQTRDADDAFAQASLIRAQNEICLPTALGEEYVLILRGDPAGGCYVTVLKGALLSPDGRYSAKAAFDNNFLAEKTMVEITVHDNSEREPDFVFSPVRSLDFWGLYWEGSRLAVDSSDVGTLYYEKDDAGQWTQLPQG